MKKLADVKIIIVDGNPTRILVITDNFRSIGYSQIKAVSSGETLLEYLTEISADDIPDLVLMETEMCGSMGYDICKQIKSTDYGKKIAVLGMSGNRDYKTLDYKTKWLEAKADGFLEKKVVEMRWNKILLAAAVNEALGISTK